MNPKEIFSRCRYVNQQGWVFHVDLVSPGRENVDYTVVSVMEAADDGSLKMVGKSCRISVEEFAGRMVDIAR
jgi:hypothetical protein